MKKITLTPDQEAWLVANYADTYNADICKRLGIKLSTMHRLAAELGLKKSDALMRAAQAAATEKARIMLKGEGNRGRMNLAIYGKPFRFKKGETSRQRLGGWARFQPMRNSAARQGKILTITLQNYELRTKVQGGSLKSERTVKDGYRSELRVYLPRTQGE